jgi:alpha-1,2-mannosyltransferase
MTELTRAQRNAFWIALALYIAVCIPVGWARGGDLLVELGLTERWLAGAPPYIASPAHGGMFWPPFTLLVLLPFALLGRIATRLAQSAWTVTSAAALAWVIATCGRRWGWRAALLAVAAVGKPLQANFERLNVGALLLGLVVAAAIDLEENRDTRAAVWIGLASAVKLFPALLILYLAVKRRWRAAAIATAVAVIGTVLPLLRYGPAGAINTLSDWVALSRTSPQASGLHAQMLTGMVTSLGGSFALAIIVQLVLSAIVLLALLRPAPSPDGPAEVGMVTQLAVLLSPIGWFHYEILALPAWVAALAHPSPPGRWWILVLALAAIFLSGILTFDHLYPDALELVKRFNYVWGALLLVVALASRRFIAAQALQAASLGYDHV